MTVDYVTMEPCLIAARRNLLDSRVRAGHWEGRLSSSALATATAVGALILYHRHAGGWGAFARTDPNRFIARGLSWLAERQNDDGGWGDTEDSPSNISTTALCWAALGVDDSQLRHHNVTSDRAESWLKQAAGGLSPRTLSTAITGVYGRDRTFAIPILTMCVLSGRFGRGRDAWRCIPALPFELAMFPHSWFRRLGLPVVSYALPALIAVGQAIHHHKPSTNPFLRTVRALARTKTLSVLQTIQPGSGGFLEAPPLTAFVVMSLASFGKTDHPVVASGVAFLLETARNDGSWPIDTNLATWLTSLSIQALVGASGPDPALPASARSRLRLWLLDQQQVIEHPYTHAAPGGWAWTDRTGGVPDADDTSGALIALRDLRNSRDPEPRASARADAQGEPTSRQPFPSDPSPSTGEHGEDSTNLENDAAVRGVEWLLDLQNSDGGIPTFCRGWSKLPFDRSAPDLTAHALRAWQSWREELPLVMRHRVDRATNDALRYLVRTQRPDGSWIPLWFGNQMYANQQNPLYGTTRVLRAACVRPAIRALDEAWATALRRASQWTLSAQNPDGGWGGGPNTPTTIEETALAVEALADVLGTTRGPAPDRPAPSGDILTDRELLSRMADAMERGVCRLMEQTDSGTRFTPAPIGLYFAKLWYSERLYPLIFTVSALERVHCVRAMQAVG